MDEDENQGYDESSYSPKGAREVCGDWSLPSCDS